MKECKTGRPQKLKRNYKKTAPYPPHFSPRASKADFNLSSPREANSCSVKVNNNEREAIKKNIQYGCMFILTH